MRPASTQDGDRRTACISSQVGCPVGCRFCASGIGGLEKNLTAGQIVDFRVTRHNTIWNDSTGFSATLTAVPEPATWALMIVGFGGAGAMLRSRRRVAA